MISLATAINASNGPAIKQEGAHDNGVGGEDDGSGVKHSEEDGEERVGQKRKRYITIVENGKKRKIVDQVCKTVATALSLPYAHFCTQTSFHPELQASIEKLKEAIKAGKPCRAPYTPICLTLSYHSSHRKLVSKGQISSRTQTPTRTTRTTSYQTRRI